MEGREAGRLLMKRENRTGLTTNPCRTPRWTQKERLFMILINYASTPVRKERLSSTSKARREASQNKFVEKGRMPDRVKSFGSGGREVGDSRKKFSRNKKKAEGRVRFHRARGSAKIREVAFGSATHGIWLRNG